MQDFEELKDDLILHIRTQTWKTFPQFFVPPVMFKVIYGIHQNAKRVEKISLLKFVREMNNIFT